MVRPQNDLGRGQGAGVHAAARRNADKSGVVYAGDNEADFVNVRLQKHHRCVIFPAAAPTDDIPDGAQRYLVHVRFQQFCGSFGSFRKAAGAGGTAEVFECFLFLCDGIHAIPFFSNSGQGLNQVFEMVAPHFKIWIHVEAGAGW